MVVLTPDCVPAVSSLVWVGKGVEDTCNEENKP